VIDGYRSHAEARLDDTNATYEPNASFPLCPRAFFVRRRRVWVWWKTARYFAIPRCGISKRGGVGRIWRHFFLLSVPSRALDASSQRQRIDYRCTVAFETGNFILANWSSNILYKPQQNRFSTHPSHPFIRDPNHMNSAAEEGDAPTIPHSVIQRPLHLLHLPHRILRAGDCVGCVCGLGLFKKRLPYLQRL
jgi:hypothetical protein